MKGSMNDLKLWFEARDTFLGINYKNGRDYREAFKIANKSKHPEAIWLCEYFKNIELPDIRKTAIDMLPDDNVYKLFSKRPMDVMDHPFMKSYYGHKQDLEYENHYTYYYKWFYNKGNDKINLLNLLKAAQLGCVLAMYDLSRYNNEYEWTIRSAINNYDIIDSVFLNALKSRNNNCYLWGKELNNLQNEMYIDNPDVKCYQEYYRKCKKVMMDTIQLWSLYVIRFHGGRINRDVRKLIIEYILLNDAAWGEP